MPKTKTTSSTKLGSTVPGVSQPDGAKLVARMQERLGALSDLALTLKHVHWNVVGPEFISVHQMLDPQYEAVAAMVDELAERMAALGGSPNGLAGFLVANPSWDDYDVHRAPAMEHLGAVELVYRGVIEDHRTAMDESESSDPVTQDLYISQIGQLEQFLWFVRAHLERADGSMLTNGARTERSAAANAGSPATSGGARREARSALPIDRGRPRSGSLTRTPAAQRAGPRSQRVGQAGRHVPGPA